MLLLGGVSFLIGTIVWKLSGVLGFAQKTPGRKQLLITSLLLCFGAGVLFATCMLHILPEVAEGLEAKAEEIEVHWLSELTICLGFFLVYFIEELVHTVLHYSHPRENLQRTFSLRKTGGDTADAPDSHANGITNESATNDE